jgi:hypothetical protein
LQNLKRRVASQARIDIHNCQTVAADKNDLLSLWLAKQVTVIVEDEQKVAGKALSIAKQNLKEEV